MQQILEELKSIVKYYVMYLAIKQNRMLVVSCGFWD